MELKFLCPYWGQEGISGKDFVDKVLSAGYDGAEINMPDDKEFEQSVLNARDKQGFVFVAQQWLPPANESVHQYQKRFSKRIEYLASLKPEFINSHTGKDFFRFEDNCAVLEDAYQLEYKHGVDIIHETHRGRFNFAAFSTRPFLERYRELKLNADFSHWTNVSESFLEDQSDDLDLAIGHSYYIHARVGHTQSAQVNDPFAPEWKDVLSVYVGWWKAIIEKATARGQKVFYICPEFGPFPYMPNQPYTSIPVQDQWTLNVNMMKYLRKVL